MYTYVHIDWVWEKNVFDGRGIYTLYVSYEFYFDCLFFCLSCSFFVSVETGGRFSIFFLSRKIPQLQHRHNYSVQRHFTSFFLNLTVKKMRKTLFATTYLLLLLLFLVYGENSMWMTLFKHSNTYFSVLKFFFLFWKCLCLAYSYINFIYDKNRLPPKK